jgi:hypothetical protein
MANGKDLAAAESERMAKLDAALRNPTAQMAGKPAYAAAPGKPPDSIISVLEGMAKRDSDDYARLIMSIREFIGQKRADLEHFERLVGTK